MVQYGFIGDVAKLLDCTQRIRIFAGPMTHNIHDHIHIAVFWHKSVAVRMNGIIHALRDGCRVIDIHVNQSRRHGFAIGIANERVRVQRKIELLAACVVYGKSEHMAFMSIAESAGFATANKIPLHLRLKNIMADKRRSRCESQCLGRNDTGTQTSKGGWTGTHNDCCNVRCWEPGLLDRARNIDLQFLHMGARIGLYNGLAPHNADRRAE